MSINRVHVGKAALVGFLVGAFLFILVSPLWTLSYFEQLWLLLGCTAVGIALSCAAALILSAFAKKA